MTVYLTWRVERGWARFFTLFDYILVFFLMFQESSFKSSLSPVMYHMFGCYTIVVKLVMDLWYMISPTIESEIEIMRRALVDDQVTLVFMSLLQDS